MYVLQLFARFSFYINPTEGISSGYTVLKCVVVLVFIRQLAVALPKSHPLETADFSTCSTDRNAVAYGYFHATAHLPHYDSWALIFMVTVGFVRFLFMVTLMCHVAF